MIDKFLDIQKDYPVAGSTLPQSFWIDAARMMDKTGNMALAVGFYVRHLKQYPTDPDATIYILRLADLLESRGQIQYARDWLIFSKTLPSYGHNSAQIDRKLADINRQ